MTGTIQRPTRLQINAWSPGSSNFGELGARTPWAQVQQGQKASRWLAPPPPADQRDWRHPDVGWGLLLPDNDTWAADAKSRGEDAPPVIQELLRSRPGSPILRWNSALGVGFLRRYEADGSAQDLAIAAPKPGIGAGRIPRYLLIVGTPVEIPWAVQYALNMSTFTGRLDLKPIALERYVRALMSDWADHRCEPRSPVIWTVDHGEEDITWLMARAVGGALWERFKTDSDLQGRLRLKNTDATGANLATSLAERIPALVVTTSHGMTGPVSDPVALKARLGVPVDAQHAALNLDDILTWKPGGAIWYAHACCSAGADHTSRYEKLFPAENAIGNILRGVASNAQAMTAPLPQALLGAESPLRAFVGHVEPTFDWTLRDPLTQQVLTHTLVDALYKNLYQQDRRTPIGFALKEVFAEAGAFYGAWQDAIAGINQAVPGMRDWALYRQLVAMDRQTLVILGDPTVALPALQ